jgi:hypothetical protein
VYEECNSEQQVSADTAAYYEYRDGGGLEADLAKLRKLVAYDNGGILAPGVTIATNDSGTAEAVTKGAS